MSYLVKGFTSKAPKDSFHGNRRHFFYQPKLEVFESPEAFQNLQVIFKEGKENPYKQTMLIKVGKLIVNKEKCISLVRKKVYENELELVPLFQKYDKDELGIVNTIKFNYILNEYLNIPEEQILTFTKVLDPSSRNLINYIEFSRLIYDPSSLEDMPLFKLGKEASKLPSMVDDGYSQPGHGHLSHGSNSFLILR